MTKTKFYNNVAENISKVLGSGVIVDLQEVTKVNLTLDGLTIRKQGENIAPTIYLNQYFNQFNDGRAMDDIVQDIIKVYENNQPENIMDVFKTEDFYDFDKMKEKIVLKVINTERNLDLLEQVPHLEMEGLGLSVVTLAKATGARRMELLRLRREDFRERTDCDGNKTGELEVFKRGKNGIERWCLVDPQYNDFVRELIATAPTYNFNGEDRLLRKADLPAKLPIHDCRSDYACSLYDYYMEHGKATGEIYSCRKDLKGIHYDKGVLAAVSWDLQHSRDSIVIDYLWKGRE